VIEKQLPVVRSGAIWIPLKNPKKRNARAGK
jgi:hypothetical protein